MPTLRERIEERSNVHSQMVALNERFEGRAFDAEGDTEWERLNSRFDELTGIVTRDQTLAAQAADTERSTPLVDDVTAAGSAEERAATARSEAFRQYLRHGQTGISNEQLRDLQANKPDLGGFLIAPETFVTQLIKFVDDQVFVRQLATTYQIATSESLGIPSLDTDIADADWTSEIATGSADTAMAFGKRNLTPHPLAKRVKISQKLMRQASMDPEALVRDRLGYKFGITTEKAYLLGNGASKPLGVFTASSDGISTNRDVTIGSTTAILADNLIDVKFNLKAAYWGRPSTKWGFHRDAIKQIRKLKDNNNNYIWAPMLGPGLAMQGGLVDTILDVPYFISEYVPNTFTTGQYVGIIGDWSYYWIVDALDMTVQRLNELYAETNQVGFIGRLETDGMPVLEEAFSRGKLA